MQKVLAASGGSGQVGAPKEKAWLQGHLLAKHVIFGILGYLRSPIDNIRQSSRHLWVEGMSGGDVGIEGRVYQECTIVIYILNFRLMRLHENLVLPRIAKRTTSQKQ